MIGNTLGLKPVLSLKEGKLDKESMTRNSKKFFQEKIKEYSKKYNVNDYDYYIVSFDGKQLLELDFYIKEKDIVNDTDVTLESNMSISSKVEPNIVYANKVNGTVVDNKVQFFVDITDLDKDIEKGNNEVILKTKVGGKEKSYTVLLAKRDLLDIR